jgi:hypothetical protein
MPAKSTPSRHDMIYRYMGNHNVYRVRTEKETYFVMVQTNSYHLWYSNSPAYFAKPERWDEYRREGKIKCIESYGGIDIRKVIYRHHKKGNYGKVGILLLQVLVNYERHNM